MFSNLNPDELEIVLGAMQEVKKNAGDEVIKQGDDGDNLYVVETGHLRCTKVFVSNKFAFSKEKFQFSSFSYWKHMKNVS